MQNDKISKRTIMDFPSVTLVSTSLRLFDWKQPTNKHDGNFSPDSLQFYEPCGGSKEWRGVVLFRIKIKHTVQLTTGFTLYIV